MAVYGGARVGRAARRLSAGAVEGRVAGCRAFLATHPRKSLSPPSQAKMQREMEGVLGGNHEVDDSGLDSMESGDIEFSNDGDSDGRGAGRDTLKRPTQPDRRGTGAWGSVSQPLLLLALQVRRCSVSSDAKAGPEAPRRHPGRSLQGCAPAGDGWCAPTGCRRGAPGGQPVPRSCGGRRRLAVGIGAVRRRRIGQRRGVLRERGGGNRHGQGGA